MFSSLLPKPKHSEYSKSIKLEEKPKASKSLILPSKKESQIVSTGNDDEGKNTISKYHLNPDGSLDYHKTIASTLSNKKFHTSYEDTIPLKKRFPNLKHHFPKYSLETCPDNSMRECLEETRSVIKSILDNKLGVSDNHEDESFIKINTSNIYNNDNEEEEDDRGRERLIHVKTYAQDPMLPPKHKLRKNRVDDPSPPPPVLRSNNVPKLSKEEQDKWKIPSAISNWKNNQGFTISLDKRMMNSSNSSAPEVNLQKLNDLSTALDGADQQAREEIKLRNEIRRELQLKEQQEKEQNLQKLAQRTRNERLKRHYNESHAPNKRSRY